MVKRQHLLLVVSRTAHALSNDNFFRIKENLKLRTAHFPKSSKSKDINIDYLQATLASKFALRKTSKHFLRAQHVLTDEHQRAVPTQQLIYSNALLITRSYTKLALFCAVT